MNSPALQELYNILMMKQEMLCQQQANIDQTKEDIVALKARIQEKEEALGVCNSLERSNRCIECVCWKQDNRW